MREKPMALARFWSWIPKKERGSSRTKSPARRFRPHLETLEDRCLLSILNVTNVNAAGAGSLAGQVAAANPGDEIVFDPGVFSSVTSPKTITLAATLSISKNLTIT